MTHDEWLASEDPAAMLRHLTAPIRVAAPDDGLTVGSQEDPPGMPSDRKLRLFACALCRQVWHLLTDQRSRQAVEVAELFADGLATEQDLNHAYRAAVSVRHNRSTYDNDVS